MDAAVEEETYFKNLQKAGLESITKKPEIAKKAFDVTLEDISREKLGNPKDAFSDSHGESD